MYILFESAIIWSTARASSVFLSIHRNAILNQSVWKFSVGYFLNTVTCIIVTGNVYRYILF